MNTMNPEYQSPSSAKLVDVCAPSRIHAKDATLYDFDPEAVESARNFMGWTTLASNPPVDIAEIQDFADEVLASGIKSVVMLGQGGSIQAPMTIAEYHAAEGNAVDFYPVDSDSPVAMRRVFRRIDPATTLVIMASKSGGTLEPKVYQSVVWKHFAEALGADQVAKHFVAITDPGSQVEKMATEEGWLKIFSGEPTVGGRFSALSVFGLVPAALLGINLQQLLASAAQAEALCAEDSETNPALLLASFLFDAYAQGRDKFSLVTPQRAYTMCLWIEQLVAESTGKHGRGVLPNMEVMTDLLQHDVEDRCLVVYHEGPGAAVAETEEAKAVSAAYEASLTTIDKATPRTEMVLGDTLALAQQFVIWEYATAMVGYLLERCPFDQPDVAVAKAKVLDILAQGVPAPSFTQEFAAEEGTGTMEVYVSDQFAAATTVEEALRMLYASVGEGDYCSINAFLPYCGEGRLPALQSMRYAVADAKRRVTNLDIGPRYLHSIGQLHKGGPNTGVFLLISSREDEDIPVDGQAARSMEELGIAQASGDFKVLSERGRRCVYVNLPNNDTATLVAFAALVLEAVSDVEGE